MILLPGTTSKGVAGQTIGQTIASERVLVPPPAGTEPLCVCMCACLLENLLRALVGTKASFSPTHYPSSSHRKSRKIMITVLRERDGSESKRKGRRGRKVRWGKEREKRGGERKREREKREGKDD